MPPRSHPPIGPGVTGPYFTEFVEGRRGEILDAALSVFAEKGYDAGTMREIATLVGVTEPALYRHYPGKEALFEDLVAEAGRRITSRAAARLAHVRPETIRTVLAGIMESRRQPQGEDNARQIVGVLMMAAPHKDALRASLCTHLLEPMVRQLSDLLPSLDAHYGVVRTPEQTTQRVRAFISLYVGSYFTSMMFGDPGEVSDAATVDAMLDMMGWNDRA